MNRQEVTEAIVLARTDYGEADRILTLLTPKSGKLRLMAKGVRRVKSKLAGGIELFSVTNVTYIRGRGDIGTLISARLVTHYGQIIQNIDRTMLGYNLIQQLNKITEDQPEPEYYDVLVQSFAALNDAAISADLIRLWFDAQLLRLGGHTPNLQTEPDGTRLQADGNYEFSFDDMAFMPRPGGSFGAEQIKFFRLLFGGTNVGVLARVAGSEQLSAVAAPLVKTMARLQGN